MRELGSLQLECNASGGPVLYQPHLKSKLYSTHRPHKWGTGPFCHIVGPVLPEQPGAYLLRVDGECVYVGRCNNLRERFGPRGYGLISPRNCYLGGQPTNCRINHRILQAYMTGRDVVLHFEALANPRSREKELIQWHRPPWNLTG